MLRVLGEVVHGLDNLAARLSVRSPDRPDTDFIAVTVLVIVAAVVVPMPTADLLPQPTNLPSFIKVATHLSTIEEEGSMDVKPLTLSLLN